MGKVLPIQGGGGHCNEYPQDSLPQDCPPRGQSVGGESWYPAISILPTPIMLCILYSRLIWVVFWGHRICFQECLTYKKPIGSFEIFFDRPDFSCSTSSEVLLFWWKEGSNCTLCKRVTYEVCKESGKKDMTNLIFGIYFTPYSCYRQRINVGWKFEQPAWLQLKKNLKFPHL